MEVKILKDKAALSDYIADLIVKGIRAKDSFNLGCATGSTYEGVYERLVKKHKQGLVSFKHVRTFNLDEYLDINEDHPETYKNIMARNFFDHVDIQAVHTHFPPSDEHAEYESYDSLIESQGGIDLQLLGIGTNGHIAFNEPGTSFSEKTHKIRLAEETRQANSRFFASLSDVPHYAVTMGIATILGAKRVLIAASGKKKADIVKTFIDGPVDENVPASALKKHDDVLVLLDEAAASALGGETG